MGKLIEKLGQGPKEVKMFAYPKQYNNINQPEHPKIPGTKPLTKEYTWCDP